MCDQIQERETSAPRGTVMKVTLKPISHPRVGDIDIVDDLFAIGRNEEPFVSGLADVAVHLSRRHARVFQEGGKLFITDLGSRHGTRVNDRTLKPNVATTLKDSDRVSFSDVVEFQVEIERAEPLVERAPLVRLVLVPQDSDSGLETIAIDHFPFLVSRNDGEFQRYREQLPAPWHRLSRRHAVITLKGGRVNVEDLQSSNGTFVSGEKLDERARELSEGEVIGFGDPLFSYKVHIESPQEPTGIRETSVVGSAHSFINAFGSDARRRDEIGVRRREARTVELPQLKPPATKFRKLQDMVGRLWRSS